MIIIIITMTVIIIIIVIIINIIILLLLCPKEQMFQVWKIYRIVFLALFAGTDVIIIRTCYHIQQILLLFLN